MTFARRRHVIICWLVGLDWSRGQPSVAADVQLAGARIETKLLFNYDYYY